MAQQPILLSEFKPERLRIKSVRPAEYGPKAMEAEYVYVRDDGTEVPPVFQYGLINDLATSWNGITVWSQKDKKYVSVSGGVGKVDWVQQHLLSSMQSKCTYGSAKLDVSLHEHQRDGSQDALLVKFINAVKDITASACSRGIDDGQNTQLTAVHYDDPQMYKSSNFLTTQLKGDASEYTPTFAFKVRCRVTESAAPHAPTVDRQVFERATDAQRAQFVSKFDVETTEDLAKPPSAYGVQPRSKLVIIFALRPLYIKKAEANIQLEALKVVRFPMPARSGASSYAFDLNTSTAAAAALGGTGAGEDFMNGVYSEPSLKRIRVDGE